MQLLQAMADLRQHAVLLLKLMVLACQHLLRTGGQHSQANRVAIMRQRA